MKKKLPLAIGALCCAMANHTLAQTNVQFIGTLDLFAGSLKNSGDAGSTAVVNSGGMTTSYYGFKGSEDLGGGLKAEMIISGFFRGDTGQSGRHGNDNMYSRDTNVALSGSFGRLQLGRTVAPSYLPLASLNPFGGSFNFSPLILHSYISTGPSGNRNWAASIAADNGWSNQIVYSSPNIAGFRTNLHYQFGETPGSSGDRNVGMNLFYSRGPLELAAFVQDVEVSNPNSGNALIDTTNAPINYRAINQQNAYFIGGSYALSKAKLYLTFQLNKDKTDDSGGMKDKIYSTGVNIPFSSGAFLAAYAHTQRTGDLVARTLRRDTFSIGYDHALSKRVDLYTILKLDKISVASTATSFGTGIRYNF